ncbi:ssDNA endonuclease and repair protein rad10 [Dispira simplex]|nr:ssDNA endonuclease and repair protein rad10 [Dispira simplex]
MSFDNSSNFSDIATGPPGSAAPSSPATESPNAVTSTSTRSIFHSTSARVSQQVLDFVPVTPSSIQDLTRAKNSPSRPPTTHAVIVNSCQHGNPVLDHIRNVPWEYGDIVPDYQVGQTSCVLFLSIRYHRLHPEYVGLRVDQLRDRYLLRILLVLVDVEDNQRSLRELQNMAIQRQLTTILAWSSEEAGRYIESFKALENKPSDSIREKVEDAYFPRLTDCLTSVRSVNKTDVVTLASNFDSFYNIVKATPQELSLCPGFGEQKTRRLRDAFTQPFVNKS